MRLFIMFGAFMICDALNYNPSLPVYITILIVTITGVFCDISDERQKNNGGK